MNQCIPRVHLSARQIIFVGLFAAAISNAIVFAISALTVFPLPFGLLVFGPPDAWVLAACFIYMTRALWRSDPYLLTEVKQQLDVLNFQMVLTFVYPLYIYGFVNLTGVMQVIFVLTLPIIRLFSKNRISRTLNTHDDMKPEHVIFTVEVFNALYVSNTLRQKSSWSLTGTVMTLDLVLFCSSMLDVAALLKDVKILMDKIPPGYPMTNENFLQVAMRILAVDDTWRETKCQKNVRGSIGNDELPNRFSVNDKALDSMRGPTHADAVVVSNGRTQRCMRQAYQNAQVVPTGNYKLDQHSIAAEKAGPHSDDQFTMDITAIFSLSERATFVDKATRVLFVTEYLVLMEYTEVMIPVIFCLHDVILFFMHNSAYYPALQHLSSADLLNSIQNISLVHLGADFSFKFGWLHKYKPNS
ncbi:hypothetical protein PF002_g7234 [Phytophthora fragariae]|uniref:Uncharacterized protein n=1 Tax=Phytophthora fragariae TaxID=53985 RepID=A0A6A4A115_9STRA|nr:hypothetical protein PF004_g5556 [Phytophthora fragariae]KAE9245495.1 hypothetical protein PF002_g7234 [Phytophthora fragariae]